MGDLYSYLLMCQALSGLLAGLAIDSLDRRWCAFLGFLLAFGSKALLVVASEGVPTLPAAMAVDGLACNMIAFPVLSLAELFPLHPNLASSFFLTSLFLGTAVTPVMWAYWKQHQWVSFCRLWTGYSVCIMLPLAIIYLLSIPPTDFLTTGKHEENPPLDKPESDVESQAVEQIVRINRSFVKLSLYVCMFSIRRWISRTLN